MGGDNYVPCSGTPTLRRGCGKLPLILPPSLVSVSIRSTTHSWCSSLDPQCESICESISESSSVRSSSALKPRAFSSAVDVE